MITFNDLYDIGFKEEPNPFTGKKEYVLGKEYNEFIGCQSPIIIYNIEKKTCKTIRSEFSIVEKFCDNKEDILKFILSINFLYNLNIDINDKINFISDDSLIELYRLAYNDGFDNIGDNKDIIKHRTKQINKIKKL